jgi:hypothetical protein
MTANLTRDLSHCGLAIYIKKYLKTKKELWKFKNSTMQKYNLKKSSKKTQNPSRYYNSNVISTQAKISSFKSPHIKLDFLPRGQNPLNYYTFQ